jgi:diguanylate cyclase (GGDEF)-like protein
MAQDRHEFQRVTSVLESVREIEGGHRPAVVVLGFALVVAIGLVDAVTDARLDFVAVYLIPLSLAVWYGSRTLGVAAGVLSIAMWLGAHDQEQLAEGGLAVLGWNVGVRLLLYIVFAVTLSALHRTLKALADALEREHELARTDGLTGIRNARAFREAAEAEVVRVARYERPLTLAYLDADGFKAVNDRYGHSTGDRVLRTIAQTLSANVRAVDVAARLGGDEFAVLFPETGPDAGLAALRKLRRALADAMRAEGVDVTFCIGVVTTLRPVESVDGLLQHADALMYEVKRLGKNDIRAEVLDPDPESLGAQAFHRQEFQGSS